MKTKFIAALLVAASASIAAPAFASGYGPAPYYRPSVGAPASQQGQNAQTVAAEQANAQSNQSNAYGGVQSVSTQSGTRSEPTSGPHSVFFGH
ncbi:conserved hypothetical protein [Burkholderia sp. H160]|nr:conserved hypothetical protein [Burkholderia sp. H160]